MDHTTRIAAAGRELDALLAAVAAGDIEASVPTCPGWTVEDLAHHVGGFLGFWTHVLCEGAGSAKPVVPPAPHGDATVPWLAERSAQMREQLALSSPDMAVWTWFEDDQSAGFVARRVAHELAVHRYDAESARDGARPIDAALAADGIDEMLDTLITLSARTGEATGQTLHLHGTDEGVDAEWLVTLLPDRIDVARTHAKGDLALRGAASDLELLLYRRPALGTVERFGDAAVLDLWYREFIF